MYFFNWEFAQNHLEGLWEESLETFLECTRKHILSTLTMMFPPVSDLLRPQNQRSMEDWVRLERKVDFGAWRKERGSSENPVLLFVSSQPVSLRSRGGPHLPSFSHFLKLSCV